MKKAYIKYLEIEVGTKCNLNCSHCYMGSKKHNFVTQPEFIDKIIENTYKINELIITGGEITLYPDVVEMVLNKFAKSKLPINKIKFISNAFLRSERIVDLFNWFSSEHTLHPNEAVIKISSDKFHTSCNPKFTKNELEENSKWYAEKTNNRAVNSASDWLALNGTAKTLKKEDITEYKEIYIFLHSKCKESKIFIKDEYTNQKGETIKNYVRGVRLSANGYIFPQFGLPESTEEEIKNNYKNSAGKITDGSLFDLIQKYNLECDKNNSPRSITILNNSFASFLLEWQYRLYNFVVEVFNFTIQNNHSFYELKRFREIDDDMTKRIETIRKYAYIYSNEEIKDCLKKYFEIEDFDVAKLKKQIESLMVFSEKTRQFKEGIISKANYRLWFYHFLEDYIKPQNEDEQKVFDLSKALYEWDLKEYERIYCQIYDILKTNKIEK